MRGMWVHPQLVYHCLAMMWWSKHVNIKQKSVNRSEGATIKTIDLLSWGKSNARFDNMQVCKSVNRSSMENMITNKSSQKIAVNRSKCKSTPCIDLMCKSTSGVNRSKSSIYYVNRSNCKLVSYIYLNRKSTRSINRSQQ